MPQSLSKIYVHLIFSTKNREARIHREWRPDLWAYLKGGLDGQGCFGIKVGGVADHVHALFELHRTVAISDLVGEIKSEATKWIKREHNEHLFSWQAGYGAFSVSASNLGEVADYISNQEAHHAEKDFKTEFRGFLEKHRVDYDERYVWD